MKKLFFTLIITFFISNFSTAQELSDKNRIAKLADAPVKENSNIYLHKIPSWEKVFPGKMIDVLWTAPMNGSQHMEFYLFGSHNFKASSNFFFRQYLPKKRSSLKKSRI